MKSETVPPDPFRRYPLAITLLIMSQLLTQAPAQ